MNAVIAFQRTRSLPPEGRLDEATLAALQLAPAGGASAADPPARDLLNIFPWIELGLRKKGLSEGKDNELLKEFLTSDGKNRTVGDPAVLPWCGDFVETCIAVTLPSAVLPANPYLARNWLKFGRTVDPCFGSILVFWRRPAPASTVMWASTIRRMTRIFMYSAAIKATKFRSRASRRSDCWEPVCLS